MKKLSFLTLLFITLISFSGYAQNAEEAYKTGLKYHNEGKYEEAMKWYQKAANQGHADAQLNLGTCYYNGTGNIQDYNQAAYWFKKAADQGNAIAQRNLGIYYYVSNDYSQAALWYQKAAKQGDVQAQSNLGNCYNFGKGVSKDYVQAAYWHHKAAEQGDAHSQYNLGIHYRNGKDYTQAIIWFRKSADYGYAEAQRELGYCYLNGNGVPQDDIQAAYWFRRAAEQNDSLGQNVLGFCYYSGRGVSKDFSQAVFWYRKAAEQGLSQSQNNLGLCYYAGEGVPQDFVQAAYWLREAATQGHENAQKLYNEIDQKIGITDKNKSLSQIKLLSSQQTNKKDYNLQVGITSKSNITGISIKVNGQTYKGVNAVKNDGYNQTINQTMPLKEGSNKIRIEVQNAAGTGVLEKYITYTKPEEIGTKGSNRRIALVIGNANYKFNPLNNPVNDANDIAAKLKSLGFEVILHTDKNYESMEKAVDDFGMRAKGYDVAMLFYSGHGIQHDGTNYLIPVDAELNSPSDIKYRCTDVGRILDKMDDSQCKMKIAVLDACRNNPVAKSWYKGASEKGLAAMNAPTGTFVAYATAAGKEAIDDGIRNSPYTEALLKTLDKPDLQLLDVFQEVLEIVAEKTKKQQVPCTYNSFIGKFYFNPK